MLFIQAIVQLTLNLTIIAIGRRSAMGIATKSFDFQAIDRVPRGIWTHQGKSDRFQLNEKQTFYLQATTAGWMELL